MSLTLQRNLPLVELGSLGLLKMHRGDEVLDDVHVLVEQVEEDLLRQLVFNVRVHLWAEEMVQDFQDRRK